jgi:hypothetical protein
VNYCARLGGNLDQPRCILCRVVSVGDAPAD